LIPEGGPAAGKTLKGIYKFEERKLIVCHIRADVERPEKRERPTGFDSAGVV
jgi:uncharacterized protein (TIGR03067 family)